MNLSKTALKGPQVYQKGKEKLEFAIREYDESVMRFTAEIVSSKFLRGITNDRHEI